MAYGLPPWRFESREDSQRRGYLPGRPRDGEYIAWTAVIIMIPRSCAPLIPPRLLLVAWIWVFMSGCTTMVHSSRVVAANTQNRSEPIVRSIEAQGSTESTETIVVVTLSAVEPVLIEADFQRFSWQVMAEKRRLTQRHVRDELGHWEFKLAPELAMQEGAAMMNPVNWLASPLGGLVAAGSSMDAIADKTWERKLVAASYFQTQVDSIQPIEHWGPPSIDQVWHDGGLCKITFRDGEARVPTRLLSNWKSGAPRQWLIYGGISGSIYVITPAES